MAQAGLRRRIIVVDDDSSVLRTVQRQLDALGWEAHPAGTAGEALSILHSLGGVDAVLTDVNMPIMDGVSLRCEVAKRFPATRVILMSGSHDGGTLRKPFTVDALAAALEATCEDRK